MLAFVDTNIWVYQIMHFDPDDTESLAKKATAKHLLRELALERQIVISAQVLSEFYTTITRKGSLPLAHHDAMIETNWLTTFDVVSIDSLLVRHAIETMRKHQVSYWDALIVEAALRAGATVLYSEDMHHGMRYGDLEIRNPFK